PFAPGGDKGRNRPSFSLGALWRFLPLFRTALSEDLQVPILHLMDALAGLEQNRVEPILKPVRRRGRAPSSEAYLHLKGYATATVERLVRIGLARQDAYQAVAKKLSQIGVRPERGSGSITSTTLRNWCDEVSSDVGRHGTAALMHDSVSEDQKRFLALPKAQARQFALQALADWALSIFPELRKP